MVKYTYLPTYKKKATNLRATFKTFRGTNSALIWKVDFRELAKMCIWRMYTIDLRKSKYFIYSYILSELTYSNMSFGIKFEPEQ